MKALLIKYETMLDALLVMDDYDGGKAEMLRTIIKDLKEIAANDDTFWKGGHLNK